MGLEIGHSENEKHYYKTKRLLRNIKSDNFTIFDGSSTRHGGFISKFRRK